MSAALGDLFLVPLEIDVEMVERMVLDVPRLVAQGFEFGQGRTCLGTLVDKPAAGATALRIDVQYSQEFDSLVFNFTWL